MKKIILLVAILSIGLTGCSMSKESMIKNATKLNVDTLNEELTTNFKAAKEKYEGNIYEISAGIISVEEKFAKIELSDYLYNDKQYLEVYFKDSELEKLKADQRITFVGKITDIDKKDNNFKVKVKKAYYISDIIEISGIFDRYDYESCFNIPVEKKYNFGGEYYTMTTKKRSCSISHKFRFIDEQNDYIDYYFGSVLDTFDYSMEFNNIKIKDGDNVTIKVKAIREKYIDDDNIIEADEEWTITEIVSIKVNE